jgi:hypothetical protein
VKQEKILEEKQQDAERKATEIMNKAREKAAQVLEEASNESQYGEIVRQKTNEIEEKERLVNKDANEKTKMLTQIAAKSRETTVQFIIELVLGK